MSKIVFLYAIPRETATGASDWVSDVSGKKLRKNKIKRCNDRIVALYAPSKGGLKNYISYTPWMNPETGTPFTNERGEPIMLQEYMEQKWNKPKGYYTNRAWRKGDSLRPDDLTYFQRMEWSLNDGATPLDLDTEDGELGYYVALDSHLVANSEKEWREHRWPKAQYYIALENESEQLKYTRNQIKSRAFAALHSNDLTDILKRKFVSLLGIESTKANLTMEQVNNALYDYIDKSTFLPGSNIDKFTEVNGLLSTPVGREQIEARFILQQAIDTRIVYEKQGTYTWVRPKGILVIGDRYVDAIDFILSPRKAAEVEELQEEIKAKLS